MSVDLDETLALRALSRSEVAARFGLGEDAVVPDVAYENLRPVDRLSTPAGHFFFQGDRQAMLYVPRSMLEGTDPAALERGLGGPPAAQLPSRTGADSELRVWPDRGVAFATDGRAVEVLEVFPPTTLERYRDEIWNDPGEFIR
jgi:hypothetical protein